MSIQLHDKTFVPFIGRDEIQQAVKKIADAINADYTGKMPILLPVLDGAFVFTADLARMLTVPRNFHLSNSNPTTIRKVPAL